jgi:mercuric reductase
MSDCCEVGSKNPKHLVVVGGGSAAFAAAIRAAEMGARATIVNGGLPMGGTCVNTGCVPSKALIRAAETYHRLSHAPFAGMKPGLASLDFGAVMAQKRELVSGLRQAKYLDVASSMKGVTLVEGRAVVRTPRSVEVNGTTLEGDALLIATGASPAVPPIPGLAEAGYLTNETALDLAALPGRLLVLGGNYIGLEMAQAFARFGVKVTVLELIARILPGENETLSKSLAGYLEAEGMELLTDAKTRGVSREGQEVVAEVERRGEVVRLRADAILVATGRRPNSRGFGLEELGATTDELGFLKTTEHMETTVAGVYAAGDVAGAPMFVYTAAYEGALAAENALGGNSRQKDYTAVPWVIFTDPQVAGVGLDEAQAKAQGLDAESSVLPLSHVPRALAARDTRGSITLVRDRESDLVLGARVLAPEGGELLMELALAMKFKIPVKALAEAFHPYLTLSEGVKLAAIAFGKDVNHLSCCAS